MADLCGTNSPLQRHQPLKARPPQHSIDLRNKPIFKRKIEMRGVYGAGPDMVGPRDWTLMGPKKRCYKAERHSHSHSQWRYNIPFLWEKQWVMAKRRWEPSTHWEEEGEHQLNHKENTKRWNNHRRRGGQSGRMLIPSL